MEKLLDHVRGQYEVVIIDSPPLLPVTDAALLAARADGAVIVLRHGSTTKEQWREAQSRLESVDATTLGVVMNMVPPPTTSPRATPTGPTSRSRSLGASAGASDMRVLHVVESYGAGTASAVLQYVRATPDVEHHLVRRLRHDDDHADDGELAHFASVSEMAAGTWSAVRSVRAAVAEVRPDVVHGHSSFGGAFARLAVRRGAGRPLVVHTPHCYRDRAAGPRPARARGVRARRAAARPQHRRGRGLLAPGDRRWPRRVAPRARHVFVPNVTDVRPRDRASPQHGRQSDESSPAWAGSPSQRDPLAFLATIRSLQQPATARWIGDGSPDLRRDASRPAASRSPAGCRARRRWG